MRLLDSLGQQTLQPAEIVVIDSGSAPSIVERLRAYHRDGLAGRDGNTVPVRLFEIPARDYQSARTLNEAIAHSHGPFVAIISQDAMPADEFYLEKLLVPLRSDTVAGVYGRQTLDGRYYPLGEKDLALTYPQEPRLQSQPDCWFVNTCSVIRRSLWEQHPFDELAVISEDHEWAKWVQSKGYVIAYEPGAVVRHYHHFEKIAELWSRFYLEGKGLAYVHGRRMGMAKALFCCTREVLSDGMWLARRRIPWYWPMAVVRRSVKYAALYKGHRDGKIARKDQPLK